MTKSPEKNAQSTGGTLIDDKIGKLVISSYGDDGYMQTGIVLRKARDDDYVCLVLDRDGTRLSFEELNLFLAPQFIVKQTPHYIIWK